MDDERIKMLRLIPNEQVINECTLIFKKNPKDALSFYLRGGAQHALNKKEEAINDITKAIDINPQFVQAYLSRGIILSELERKQEAINDFNKAIEINPLSSKAYYNRGVVFNMLNKKQEAINDYTKTTELDPKCANAYNYRGVLSSTLNRKQEALKDITKAIQINPQCANAYNNRGLLFNELNRKKEAINDYTKALKFNPHYANAYNNRGKAFGYIGKQEAALADLIKAIEIAPNNLCYVTNLGSLYFVYNQHDLALNIFMKVKKIINQLTPLEFEKFNLTQNKITFIITEIDLLTEIQTKLQQTQKLIDQKLVPKKEIEILKNLVQEFKKELESQIIKRQKDNPQIFTEKLEYLSQKLQKYEKYHNIVNQIQISEEGKKQNESIYFQSFSCIIFNYLNACLQIYTSLFQENSLIKSPQRKINYFTFNKTSIVAGYIPSIDDIFGLINNIFDLDSNQRRLNERISRLATLIKAISINLELEVKHAGRMIAQELAYYLIKKHSPQQQFTYYSEQISQAEEKQKLKHAQNRYWKLGIEHCLIVLINLENNYEELQKDQEGDLSQMIIDALNKPTQGYSYSNQVSNYETKLNLYSIIQ